MILIKNTTIIDGSGLPGKTGDILIDGECIGKIAPCITDIPPGTEIIDGTGLYTAPGFIDFHSHTDLDFLEKKRLKPKITQGITTEVTGVCGLGAAPVCAGHAEEFRKNLIIGCPDIPWSFNSLPEYLELLNNIECNIAPFAGHGVLRYCICQNNSHKLSETQINQMQHLVQEVLSTGIFGISFGFIYVPAVFADISEISSIASCIPDNYIIPVHLRNESNELSTAAEEAYEFFGSRLHISHLKAIGRKNVKELHTALSLIEKYNISFDSYPYTYGNTSLLSLVPPFMLKNSVSETLAYLRNPDIQNKLHEIYIHNPSYCSGLPWDNLMYYAEPENIYVENARDKTSIGKSIAEISESFCMTPAQTVCCLLEQNNGNVRIIDYYTDTESLETVIKHPAGVFGSDSLTGEHCHPRVYGTFPRILSEYVFRRKILSPECAIQKMTAHPASLLGLKKRGMLSEGYYADITVFSDSVHDCANPDNPGFSEGIIHVLINGEFKIRNSVYLNTTSGKLLRKD